MSAQTQNFVLVLIGIAIVVAAYLLPGVDPSAQLALATFGGTLVGGGGIKRIGDQKKGTDEP